MDALLVSGVVAEPKRQERLLLLLSAAFVAVNSVALSLSLEGTLVWNHFWAPLVWLFYIVAGHLLLNRFSPNRDPLLFPLYALLTGWGLILLDRLAPNFLPRQTLWLGIATAAALTVAILPRSLRLLRRYRYTWLTIGLVLLAATLLFGVNPSGAGAALWLQIPLLEGVYFQPSELLKLLLVVFLASYFDEQEQLAGIRAAREGRSHLTFLAPLLLMWGFSILLLVWQRDLGAASIFFVTFLTLLYLATGQWRYVAGGLALMVVAGIAGYFLFSVVELRVQAWLNPWPDATDRAFQIVQSLYALAAGGVTGQGVGQGFPYYIPVVHSDFVFAAVAEEWGMVGSIAVLSAFAILGHRGLRIAALSPRAFNVYLAAGITVLFCTQAFLIMAGVTRLLPLTGVTLPFMSYGGSSLLISGVMLGLLLYLSQRLSPHHH
jgi:peptidoglycan glycosyltransferase